MPEFCTCGARLPEDARFCHKCGRPTRDEPVFIEEAPPVPAAPPPPQFPPIGFHNGPAVRAALLSGVLAFLLLLVSSSLRVPAAFALGLVGAGFLAVYLYQRRTGQRLSMVHGAHLGWISGVFGFAITAVLLSAVLAELSNPAFLEAMREQLKTAPADFDQVMEMMRSPSGMLLAAALMFLMFTVLPACGGALGAKFLGRD